MTLSSGPSRAGPLLDNQGEETFGLEEIKRKKMEGDDQIDSSIKKVLAQPKSLDMSTGTDGRIFL